MASPEDEESERNTAGRASFWRTLNADLARAERAVARVGRSAGRAPRAAVPEASPAPCFGQTAESVKAWLTENVREGAEVVVRETQWHRLVYTRAVVTGLGKGRFRVASLRRDGTLGNEDSFYYSGKHCFYPKGQTRLVVPTPAVVAAADELAAAGATVPPWVVEERRLSIY